MDLWPKINTRYLDILVQNSPQPPYITGITGIEGDEGQSAAWTHNCGRYLNIIFN